LELVPAKEGPPWEFDNLHYPGLRSQSIELGNIRDTS
jgi:hypothetical protein